MNILAIRFARLGDVALLLPALGRIKAAFPDSRLTLLTGHRCAPLARMSPSLDEVLSVDRVAMKEGPPLAAVRPILGLLSDVRRQRFDVVVDFHGLRETGLLTWLSGAPRRLGLKRWDQSSLPFCYNLPQVIEDKGVHVSRMFAIVADHLSHEVGGRAVLPSGPSLVVPGEDRAWWTAERAARGVEAYVVLYVDAPVRERIWPMERFARLGDSLIQECGASVVVVSGPGREDLIQEYFQLTRHPGRVAGFADLPVSRVAAIIESAALMVSNDTGPMHLGPLVETPTLGLFSVGLPEHFRPIGPNDAFLKANPISQLEVGEVLRQAESMWRITRSGLRR
ncbi:MAG TPA: glycosyltransferase family 9 protein [Terriglobia bacterium]|nr:glycosyltransferase family 9 protein [Terriglobia bacterium]